ncbi:hypothetical protein N2152v2_004923 [Parachlorella kessleri]
MQQSRLVELQVDQLGTALTAVVGPEQPTPDRPAFVLLHGFDGSHLEFRRLYPLLSQLGDVYAVDLAGWGFTDVGAAGNPGVLIGPEQKREHLYAIWRDVVGQRPMVLLGTSLGGTVAMDFALHYPEAVDKLVLAAPQGFIDGLGVLPKLPRYLQEVGVKVLQSDWLRDMANQMAYHDKPRLATVEARRIGQLHTSLPGWMNANIAFMRSGGYSISGRISQVKVPTLVVWGRNDEILDPKNAQRFLDTLPDARLEWIEQCGHCIHLEQPEKLVEVVATFLQAHSAAGPASPLQGSNSEGAAMQGLAA